MGRVARFLIALAVCLGVGACSAIPTSTPGPASASPGATVFRGSQVPPAPPSPTPPTGGLAEWRQLPAQDSLRGAEFVSVVDGGDRLLGLGCLTTAEQGCVQPAIWQSGDGLEWDSAGAVVGAPGFSTGTVVAAASSRIGLVAAGNVSRGDNVRLGVETQASIWLQSGEGWAQITPRSAADSTIHALFATGGRVVAIGSGAFLEAAGFRAWWSADGTTWQDSPPIGDSIAYATDILPIGSGLLAWGPSCGVCVPTTAWWLSVDGTVWRSVEPPRGLDGANIEAIGRTEGGYIAFGTLGGGDQPVRPTAWLADETAADWRQAEAPPQGEATSVRHYRLVGRGSIAAGNGPPGPGREQQTGLVWLREPGESAWRDPVAIPDFEIVGLVQDPRQHQRIVVVGRTFEGLEQHLVLWTGLVDWPA